jgi:hypothetical protein
VDVNHIRPETGENTAKFRERIRGDPELARGNLNLRNDSLYGIVVGVKALNLNPVPSKQARLCIHDGIFTAALLIPIMDDKDFHRCFIPRCPMENKCPDRPAQFWPAEPPTIANQIPFAAYTSV